MTEPTPSTGAGQVPRTGIIVLSVLAMGLALVGLYSLWAFWPMTGASEGDGPQRISWFGWHTSVDREFLFFLVVALAGALGGLIHTVRSFSWYVGNRSLVWSWVPHNILLPIVGALAGTVFYLVLRAGLFSPSTSVDQASPFGFAAVAILAGLFSTEAFEKLRVIATEMFAKSPEGEDHVAPLEGGGPPPAPPPPPGE
jgi:hypothetical protein